MSALKEILAQYKKRGIAAMQIMRDAEAVRFYYNYKNEPYCRAEEPNGDVYIMRFDGTTFLVSGGKGMLVQGCPYPWKIGITAHFFLWCHQHRHQLPFFVLGAILAIASHILLSIVYPHSPAWFAIPIIMNVTFFICACGAALIFLGKMFGPALVEVGEDLYRTHISGKGPKALNAGDFHIGEDILVYSYQDESGFAFSERCEAKRREGNALGKFVFIVPYDSLFMQVVYPDGWVQKVTGHLVPDVEYAGDNWHKDKSPLDIKGHRPKGSGYLSQPYDEFLDFVRAVCPAFRAWAEEQKMTINPNAFDTMINLKRATATFVFVCLSVLSVVAQDLSGQINKYLGTLSGKAAPQTEIVCYFKNDQSGEEFEIKLASDGMATWSNIVKAGRFDNNRTGRLQAIFAGEDKVVPSAAFVSSPRTAARQADAESAQPSQPNPGSFWERLMPLDKMEAWKADLKNGIIETGRQIQPRQEFLGVVAWYAVLPFWIIGFALCYMTCRVGFNEIGKSHARNPWLFNTMSKYAYKARSACFILVMLLAGMYFLNEMVADYFESGANIPAWLVEIAIKGGLIYLAAIFLVPDPPGSHKQPQGDNGRRGGGNGDFPMPTQ